MNTSEPSRGSLRPGPEALRYPGLDRFVTQARQLVAAGVRSLVVDLGAVDEMDVSAIGALVQIHSTLKSAGGELRLMRAQPWIASMLRVSGVDRIVWIDLQHQSSTPTPVRERANQAKRLPSWDGRVAILARLA
jgi:anti-anti-sigma factor